MTGPNWPRRRYELIVKKGTAPLGLKLHQTKVRRGVYTNGFAEGAYPPPGPQACMRVGDILVSVDGKDLLGASLPAALAAIEAARRRDRLRDFISAKQDDYRKGNVALVFERMSPRLTFRDVALDPRKVVYLLNYMLEVRRSTSSKEEVSLDEARLMFWLEVQVLFEMSMVMTPSREDMTKVYDKFFRQGSGFYVHELSIKSQTKKRPRKSWDGQVFTAPRLGSRENGGKEEAVTSPTSKQTTAASPAADSTAPTSGKNAFQATSRYHEREGIFIVEPAGFVEEEAGGGGKTGSAAGSTPESVVPEAILFDDDEGMVGGGGGDGGGESELPNDLLAGDLSKMFRASQEKVEATLTVGAFFRFKTSPWFGRMVAHLANSPDFVHVPFETIMAEQELRDVMMLHMIIGQVPGWLQVWREIEMSVKPRLAVLQTRRSVRQRSQTVAVGIGNGGQRHRRSTFPGSGEYGRGVLSGSNGGAGLGAIGGSSLHGTVEAKADAAVAIVASAVYLWDFFISSDSHASLGLARNTTAYVTLRELLVGNPTAATDDDDGGGGDSTTHGLGAGNGDERMATTAAAKVAALSSQGGDAGVDLAVLVGKALLDMQRELIRKLCASIYPDFQSSSTYEHLCEELTSGGRSLRRPASVATGISDYGSLGSPAPPRPISIPVSRDVLEAATPSPRWLSTEGKRNASGEPLLQPHPWSRREVAGSGSNVAGVFLDGLGEERPRSPYVLVGGGDFASKAGEGDGSPRRSSEPPPELGDNVDEQKIGGRDALAEALAYRSEGQEQEQGAGDAGTTMGLSGPAFDELWRAWQGGCILDKVMRRIDLPPHVSRHRPPFGAARVREVPDGDEEAWPAVRRLSRSGSGSSLGSASPELRRHLCLPHKTRRFGRRPYPIAGDALRRGAALASAPSPDSPPNPAQGDLDPASPPEVLTRRTYVGRGDEGEGNRSVYNRGVPGGVAAGWCAEWAVSFTGRLEQGVTTVKTERAVRLACREGTSVAAPEGLEAFFWPELPADGRGPCACNPYSPPAPSSETTEGARDSGARRRKREGRSGSRNRSRNLCAEYCSRGGKRPLVPPPRLITFAAPGRDGVGTFYGVCLSIFRMVPQWVGERPASPLAFDSHSSSPSAISPATAPATAAAVALSVADSCDAALGTGVPTGEASVAVAVAMADAVTPRGEERAVMELEGVAEGLRVSAGGLEGSAASAATATMTTAMTKAATTAVTAVVETTTSSSSSVIDLSSRLRRGMGIFSKAPLGHSKVSPSTAGVATRSDNSAGLGGGGRAETISVPLEDAPAAGAGAGVVTNSSVFPETSGGAYDEAGNPPEAGSGDVTMAPPAEERQDARVAEKLPPPPPSPSRFKMAIGIFSAGKSPSGLKKGWGSGSGVDASSGSAASASAGTGRASKTPSFSATVPIVTPAPPPVAGGGGGGGGGGKFTSYARRAGSFMGSAESRNTGRSNKPHSSAAPSPEELANDPPPPAPGIPTYLASRSAELAPKTSLQSSEKSEGNAENTAVSFAADREVSCENSLASIAEAGLLSVDTGADMGVVPVNAASAEGGGMKARSMSATTSDSGGFGSSLSGSPRGSIAAAAAAVSVGDDHGGGHGREGRHRHVFYVPSGVCLLSTSPEIGAMRRALAAYWSAHANEVTASAAAAWCERGEEWGKEAYEGDVSGGEFGDLEADAAASPGTETETGKAEAWTRLTADELRDALSPFAARGGLRPDQNQSQEGYKQRRRRQASEGAASVGAGTVTTTIDVVPRSLSSGNVIAAAAVEAGGIAAGEHSGVPERGVRGAGGEGGQATLSPMSPMRSGAKQRAESFAGSRLDFDPSLVFRCLSPRHLCLVVTALLCERKVVMVSSRLSLLTMAGEVYRSLLQPLSWSHVYVPLLPRRMAGDLLQCPTPYLLGLDSETASGLELPKDAIQVHLDTDGLLVPRDFVGLAPMAVLCARLSSVWNPGLDDLDYPHGGGEMCRRADPTGAQTADSIRFLFREFVSELLQGAAECTFEVGRGSTLTVLLDERLYKRAKAAAAREAERFYEEERRFSPWGRGWRSGEAVPSAGGGPLYNRHCGALLDQFVKTQMLSHFLSEGTWFCD